MNKKKRNSPWRSSAVLESKLVRQNAGSNHEAHGQVQADSLPLEENAMHAYPTGMLGKPEKIKTSKREREKKTTRVYKRFR
ncbi:hypothetical protein RUM43_007595 [Polyplax serrata]|uniref:Uncharacterized protein n=1 Tax=Polyplax serrata TaxID=468196 RepID=A0AAN8PMI5_POLSC